MAFEQYGLGRNRQDDSRSQLFQLSTLLNGPQANPYASRFWQLGPTLDQGQTPQCVGYGCKNWIDSAPFRHTSVRLPFVPATLYTEAQGLDGDPTPHDGTSVLAGLKAMQLRGLIDSYWWANSPDDIVQAVLKRGAVIVGTDWTEQMFTPDSKGLVVPDGQVVGGHCWLIYGWDGGLNVFHAANSWGKDWGISGHFIITLDNFKKLWSQGAEAVSPLERHV